MRVEEFITELRWEEVPPAIREKVAGAVLDVLASALAGTFTPASHIMSDFVESVFSGSRATVLGRGRVSGAAGAALANACSANALDIDDGFRLAKGHPGAVVVPAALAQAEALGASGPEFLRAVLIGYEVAMRASVLWHAHPHRGPSYHGSGSWGALGAAAACAALRRLDSARTLQALGIAEYHAPLAPIMTCVENPAMVKDGIHWGAFCGVTAADLAERGFTGIPSLLSSPESEVVLRDLGQQWWIERLYFKFFPCCRWAQPAVACALELVQEHRFKSEDLRTVRIETFKAATHLRTRKPATTEEAQYSLAYPVACVLAKGRFGVAEAHGPGLQDPEVLALAERIELVAVPEFEARFPSETLARLSVVDRNGRMLSKGPLGAPGDVADAVRFEALEQKCVHLTKQAWGREGAERLVLEIRNCSGSERIESLCECLANYREVAHDYSLV